MSRGLQSIYRPNLFAFPGIRPGLDPAHPASSGCFFSFVGGVGGNTSFSAVNILTGLRATQISGGGLASIQGDIGTANTPAGVAGSGGGLNWSTLGIPASNNITAAGIFRIATNTVVGRALFSLGATIHTVLITSSTGVFGLRLGGTNFLTTIVPNANMPYFLAVSSVASKANFVLLNLANGSLLTATNILTTTVSAQTNLILGNNSTGGNGCNGPIAAAMCSTAALTFADLLAWAADPWAFWYPRTLTDTMFDSLAAQSAAAAFKAAWALGKNIVVEGVAT